MKNPFYKQQLCDQEITIANNMVVALKIGLTNSCFATHNGANVDFSPLLPTVLAKKGSQYLIGHEAAEQAFENPRNTIFSWNTWNPEYSFHDTPFTVKNSKQGLIFEIGNEDMDSERLNTCFIREFLQEKVHAAQKNVIIIPSSYPPSMSSALIIAVENAGLRNVLSILEEKATLIGQGGLSDKKEKNICLIDFGGQTTSLSICHVDGEKVEVLKNKTTYFGSDDLTSCIIYKILESHDVIVTDPQQQRDLWKSVENWKKQLSINPEAETDIGFIADKYGEAVPCSVKLNYSEVRSLFKRYRKQLILSISNMMESNPSKIDEVCITGGGARMPLIQKWVKEYFVKDPIITKTPELDSVKGAAIWGHKHL